MNTKYRPIHTKNTTRNDKCCLFRILSFLFFCKKMTTMRAKHERKRKLLCFYSSPFFLSFFLSFFLHSSSFFSFFLSFFFFLSFLPFFSLENHSLLLLFFNMTMELSWRGSRRWAAGMLGIRTNKLACGLLSVQACRLACRLLWASAGIGYD